MSMQNYGDLTAAQKAVLDRVLWRVMPLVIACMVIGTIDRSNIGFAKLSMVHDLKMSEAVFALGSSLLYFGYLVFEIPSALGAHRFGARIWLSRIMATWGLATLFLAFTDSTWMFYLLRFLLGAGEAGLYPALLFYITLWFPKAYIARAMGMLTIGSALGNGLGALVAGPLLDLNGVLGLAGWRWIFLVTGAVPMIGVLVIMATMHDSIAQAKFLSEAEKEELSKAIEPGGRQQHRFVDIIRAVAEPKVLGHGLVYATLLTALFGVIYWSPSVVKTFGVTGTQNGLLVALPWAIDAVLLLIIPARLRNPGMVLKTMIGLQLLGSIAFAAAASVDDSMFRYAMLLVGIPCISVGLALYWTYPTRMFRGAPAAAALATISTLGNMGGLVGQNLMPALAEAGGSTSAALIAPCFCLGVLAIGGFVVLVRGRGAREREAQTPTA